MTNRRECGVTLLELVFYLLAIVLGCFITWAAYNNLMLTAVEPNSTESTPYIVQQGNNWKSVAKDLENRGLLKNWWSFYLTLKLKKMDTSTLIPGEYSLSPSFTPERMVRAFIDKEMIVHKVVIAEGKTNREITALLVATGLVSATEIEMALRDPSIFAKYDIPASSLEGYLFPATYEFYRPTSAQDMIGRMLNEGVRRRTQEMMERSIDLGMTYHSILTLASIIEKETSRADERAIVSSLYQNRLRIGMPLQSDPTVIYGVADFNGNLTREHLNTDTPYNTYIHPGLPPTPVCNPGEEAIKAALYPDKTEYLFMVAKGDGSHVFSKQYSDHVNAVNQYQRKKTETTAEIE